MWLGVDYYPEQWDAAMLEADLDNILELGCNVIRIGEFLWHMMEPVEGQYDFSYFDRVIEKAKEKGLHVIMGNRLQRRFRHGWLRNIRKFYLSLKMVQRDHSGADMYIVSTALSFIPIQIESEHTLVNHYKDEESIVAWQIDNEFGHEGSDACYCKQDKPGISQEYLRIKFKGDINLVK